ncbi:MAG: hypothetical protein K0Q76_4234 [Panacagrimonas sp.]|jgi:hypothetical protein|nr:hypothetical protein [Panacagrimonas sp.]MCC2659126.1 hypothetical protein [Panacagrimonas sp.]
MKLGTFLWRVGLVAIVAAGVGQYWLVQRTHEAAARLVARLIPQGELRYERLWPFPWGGGRAWGLSFQPEGMLQVALQTPTGMRVEAREMRLRELRYSDDGTIERVRGSLLDVRVPVTERRSPIPEQPEVGRMPAPTLFDLGYTQLRFDLEFDIQYVASSRLALVHFNAAGADIGHAALSAQLEGTPQVFDRAPDQIMVRKLELEFADSGLLRRFKDVSAARARLGRTAWEDAMLAYLDRRARKEGWKWDAETARSLQAVVRQSDYVRMKVDPPGDVALRNIRLYPVADWPTLLGFGMTHEGRISTPPPVGQRS